MKNYCINCSNETDLGVHFCNACLISNMMYMKKVLTKLIKTADSLQMSRYQFHLEQITMNISKTRKRMKELKQQKV